MPRFSLYHSRGVDFSRIADDSLRRCSGCGQWLPVDAFSIDRSRPSGRKSRCKVCDRAKSAAYYQRKKQARKGEA
jgi:hypothetical protein